MFSSAKYSDLTIRCGPDEYKLHRVIVCARSDFFAKACDGEYREAKTATIDLTDDDPQTVKRMLTYLYTLEYDDGQRQAEEEIEEAQQERQESSSAASHSPSATVEDASSPEDAISTTLSSPLLISHKDVIPAEAVNTSCERMMGNVLVYALADKYDIPELKSLAKAKFSTLVGAQSSVQELSAITNAVFTTTPESDLGLREIVINKCSESVQAALKNENIISTMEQQGCFALGVLRHIVGRVASVEARLGETLIREDVLRADLATSEEEKLKAFDEKLVWLSKLKDDLVSANDVDKCRHCRADFCSELENVGVSTLILQLRCAKCGARHYS